MVRRPPRPTRSRSSAASVVYKCQVLWCCGVVCRVVVIVVFRVVWGGIVAVCYAHLRAHETGSKLVCRLVREKKSMPSSA